MDSHLKDAKYCPLKKIATSNTKNTNFKRMQTPLYCVPEIQPTPEVHEVATSIPLKSTIMPLNNKRNLHFFPSFLSDGNIQNFVINANDSTNTGGVSKNRHGVYDWRTNTKIASKSTTAVPERLKANVASSPLSSYSLSSTSSPSSSPEPSNQTTRGNKCHCGFGSSHKISASQNSKDILLKVVPKSQKQKNSEKLLEDSARPQDISVPPEKRLQSNFGLEQSSPRLYQTNSYDNQIQMMSEYLGNLPDCEKLDRKMREEYDNSSSNKNGLKHRQSSFFRPALQSSKGPQDFTSSQKSEHKNNVLPKSFSTNFVCNNLKNSQKVSRPEYEVQPKYSLQRSASSSLSSRSSQNHPFVLTDLGENYCLPKLNSPKKVVSSNVFGMNNLNSSNQLQIAKNSIKNSKPKCVSPRFDDDGLSINMEKKPVRKNVSCLQKNAVYSDRLKEGIQSSSATNTFLHKIQAIALSDQQSLPQQNKCNNQRKTDTNQINSVIPSSIPTASSSTSFCGLLKSFSSSSIPVSESKKNSLPINRSLLPIAALSTINSDITSPLLRKNLFSAEEKPTKSVPLNEMWNRRIQKQPLLKQALRCNSDITNKSKNSPFRNNSSSITNTDNCGGYLANLPCKLPEANEDNVFQKAKNQLQQIPRPRFYLRNDCKFAHMQPITEVNSKGVLESCYNDNNQALRTKEQTQSTTPTLRTKVAQQQQLQPCLTTNNSKAFKQSTPSMCKIEKDLAKKSVSCRVVKQQPGELLKSDNCTDETHSTEDSKKSSQMTPHAKSIQRPVRNYYPVQKSNSTSQIQSDYWRSSHFKRTFLNWNSFACSTIHDDDALTEVKEKNQMQQPAVQSTNSTRMDINKHNDQQFKFTSSPNNCFSSQNPVLENKLHANRQQQSFISYQNVIKPQTSPQNFIKPQTGSRTCNSKEPTSGRWSHKPTSITTERRSSNDMQKMRFVPNQPDQCYQKAIVFPQDMCASDKNHGLLVQACDQGLHARSCIYSSGIINPMIGDQKSTIMSSLSSSDLHSKQRPKHNHTLMANSVVHDVEFSRY